MASMEVTAVLSQIEGKMQAELKDGHPYEALQYVQSFVARKKKALGQDLTSKVVFHGAKQLVLSGASSSAGTLLKWYLEEGAGVEYSFRLSAEVLTAGTYCDVQRLIDIITPLTSDQAYPIIDIVYDPLHLFVAKLELAKSAIITSRLDHFEALCAKTFLDAGVFYGAFKCYLRLGKVAEAVETVSPGQRRAIRLRRRFSSPEPCYICCPRAEPQPRASSSN